MLYLFLFDTTTTFWHFFNVTVFDKLYKDYDVVYYDFSCLFPNTSMTSFWLFWRTTCVFFPHVPRIIRFFIFIDIQLYNTLL